MWLGGIMMRSGYSFIVIVLGIIVGSEQCGWDNSSYKYFGAKTLYEDVRGDIRNVTKLKGCEPISIWLLSRHGARNPDKKSIDQMKMAMGLKEGILKSHAEGKGELCDKDITNLQSWKWNETIDSTPYYLTSRGYKELIELGSRINETYYTLLKDLPLNYIRSTNEQRTIESCKSFFSGLDAKPMYKIQDPLEKSKDLVLFSFMNCERYEKEVWNGATLGLELEKYCNTEEYKKLLQDIQRRTGLSDPLTPQDVFRLYDLYRYYRSYSETARSAWCAIFSDGDLEVMEYVQDLRHYIRSGYGSPINLKLSEPVLEDLLLKFQDAVYQSQPSFTAYFSHDILIDMMYSALGLFRDEPGLSGVKRDPDRKWRTSLSTPFAANVIAVLYNCTDRVDCSQHRVQFFANEKLLRVCEDACSWRAFEDKLKPFVNSSLSFCKINTT